MLQELLNIWTRINKETYSADWYDEKYIYSITAEVHFAEFVRFLKEL